MSELPSYDLKFCPYCGEKLGSKMVEEKERCYCNSCDRVIWQNPKPAVAVAVQNKRELLLVERGIPPEKGMFSLPAGFIDRAEKPEVSAVRELEEETGLEIEAEDLEIFDTVLNHRKGRQYTVVIVYRAETSEEDVKAGSDTAKAEFWSREKYRQNRERVREPYRKIIEDVFQS